MFTKPNETTVIKAEAVKAIPNIPAGTIIEIVGAWVWITFPGKPAAEIRDALKSLGFRWIHSRGKWAHACGEFTRHGKGDPRDKYETQTITV